MPESLEQSVERNEDLDKRGIFRWEKGEIKRVTKEEYAEMKKSAPVPEVPVHVETPASKPISDGKFQEDSDPTRIFQAPTSEALNMYAQKEADATNNVMAESERSEVHVPVETESMSVVESTDPKERLLSAKSIDAFIAICDELQAKNESIEINGEPYGGNFVKRSLEAARDSIRSGKKLIEAAGFIGRIPKSELRDKLEQLLNIKGIMETARAVEEAYTQAA
ncbi:MAG: hypothetical protein AAB479_03135 [Patescibacteria group bacterium]